MMLLGRPGLSLHLVDSLLVLLMCCVHLTHWVMLTDIFPSFVVTVRANPSLDPRNGEILWGIPILKRCTQSPPLPTPCLDPQGSPRGTL